MNPACDGERKVKRPDPRLAQVSEKLAFFRSVRGALIPVLHEVQDLYGYLPEEALLLVSKGLNIPMAEIYGVATFYSFFSLEPKGDHVVRVCMGTACYIKRSQSILDRLCSELKVKGSGTTEDGRFTIEPTRCLGACGLAPVVTIDEKVHGRLSANDVPKLLKGIDRNVKPREKQEV
jgi:NADH:ubiquinone oxidoreductase subunit E